MAILELSDEQVVELVKQLPPERRRAALLALAAGASRGREERMGRAEEQLRRLCAERGLEWDGMSEDQRAEFIDDLTHEDRQTVQAEANELRSRRKSMGGIGFEPMTSTV